MNNIEHELHKMRFFIIALVPLFLADCNTIEGAGTDIKHAGKAIESTAEESKADHHCHCPYPCCTPKTQSHKVRN